MDALRYLKLLQRRWWVVVAVLIASLLAGFLTLPQQDDPAATASSYTATHTLLQAPETETAVNLPLIGLFATTGEVPRTAARNLGLPEAEGPLLASEVDTTVDAEVGALRLTVVGTDPQRTASVANAFGEAVKEFLRVSADTDRRTEAEAVQQQLDSLQARIVTLGTRLQAGGLEAPVIQAQQSALTTRYQASFERLQALQEQGPATSSLATLEEAVAIPNIATGSPVPTSRTGRLGLAGLVGLLLGAGLVLVVDRLDTRVRTREDVEAVTGIAVITEVPRIDRAERKTREVTTAVHPAGAVAEAYRALRSALLLIPARPVTVDGSAPVEISDWRPPQVVLITSASPGDGKTTTTVNLAAALAESGRSVIVLDADFRKPTANQFLGVSHSVGLSELLTGSVRGGLSAALQSTSVPGVRLVTSGSSSRHPAALLARLGDLVAEARTMADFVLIDSAPLLVANDATDIVPHVDAVLLVAQAVKTTGPQGERTVELLARLGVPVLGYVLQASRDVDPTESVGYYSAAHNGPPPRRRGPRISPGPRRAPRDAGREGAHRRPAQAPAPTVREETP